MPPADNPDAKWLPRLGDGPVAPIFISGPHRSGTTFLYLLLQATGRFNVMTAYHVLRYRELLTHHFNGTTGQAKKKLAAEFRRANLPDRGIDGVPLTTEMPEEYGFVLAAQVRPSLRPQQQVTPANLPLFKEICRKLQFLGEPGRPLLLKNPYDAENFLFLKREFPGAKFLFLHRDPARTLNSQLHAARSLLMERNAYVAMLSATYARVFRRPLNLTLFRVLVNRLPGLAARMLVDGCARPLEFYLQHRKELPEGSAFDVRYEDLCAAPNETIAAILGWLGLSRAGLPDFREMVSPRGGGLSPAVERLRPKLERRLAGYYKEFGERREG